MDKFFENKAGGTGLAILTRTAYSFCFDVLLCVWLSIECSLYFCCLVAETC